jgi:CDP-4-dehydro-6-deoxyglucose reductase
VEELVEGQMITRAYSIASPPDGNRFELCLNRVRDGHLSPYLFTLNPGDTVEMRGPYGTFILRDPPNDSVLVANGTGIAPFRAMLPARLARDAAHRITLLFGVRHEHDLLYRAEFEALERRHLNFRFWPTLTRPEAGWTGRKGRVQQHLTEVVGCQRDLDVYICGLREMVDEVRAMLRSIGFDRKRMIYEKYD